MDEILLHQLDRDWHEAQHQMRTRLRRMQREAWGAPVGGAGFRLVAWVLQSGPQSPAELAKALEIRTSTLTAHLDRLEELGWVTRQSVVRGPSRVQVEVTPAGEKAYEEFLGRRRAVLAELVAPLSEGDTERLAALLHTLVEGAPTGQIGATRGTPDFRPAHPSEVR